MPRPSFRLTPAGRLRRSILLGVAAAGAALAPGLAAAPFGSPAWFAAQPGAGATAPAGAGAPPSALLNPAAAVSTPAAALQHADRSIANLQRAADAIVAAQAAQSAARQLALAATTTVADGLAPGGLVVAAGAAADAADPQGCAPTNSCLWQNAALPTQAVAGGKTTVTVQQTAKKAILSWESFDIGQQTTLVFDQAGGRQTDGSNDWVALNRVSAGASPSRILGRIEAEGSIYLINQNGIIFGGSSAVNVHALIASTLPLYLQGSSTTLTPGDDPAYLAHSNRLFLETGINSIGSGTAAGNILGLGSGQTIAKSRLGALPGDIHVEAGARIATDELGFSLLAAPNISNAGTIESIDGQVILAAGIGVSLRNPAAGSLLLQPVLTGRINDDRNRNEDATPKSQLLNTGLISSVRGNIRLMGFDIRQDGIVAATTSVTRPGSIALVAEDEQATDSAQSRTGSLRLGDGSVTTLLPDANGETTLSSPAADALFKPGTITLSGGAVTLENGSLIEAPGQNVTVSAVATSALTRSGLGDDAVQGRIYIDAGAVIDVSGLANIELPMTANLVTIPRIGQNELADTPVQRDGVLFGAPLTIDIRRSGVRADGVAWTGTPLANVGGYVQQAPRKIGQLLQNGGNITLAGDEVIARSGSQIELDGGFVHYLGGVIETTRLVAANGAVFDVGSADPALEYVAIAGRHTDAEPRWNTTSIYSDPVLDASGGVYESAYVQGGNAGTLSVYAHSTALLDGDLSAQAVAGRYQVASGRMPAGGRYYAGAGAGNSLLALVFRDQALVTSGPSYVLQDGRPDIGQLFPGFDAATVLPRSRLAVGDTANLDYWIPVSTTALADAGFASVTIAADDAAQINQGGEIVVAPGRGLAVQPGGSITLTGSRVTILADLGATAGSIAVTATGNTAVPGSTPRPRASSARPAPGDIVVGAGVVLDASGQWVNDAGFGQDEQTGGAFVNGGRIVLRTLQRGIAASTSGAACGATADCVSDTTGSILLAEGSLLDVSSGGRVLPGGSLWAKNGIPLGTGGSISLLTYATTDTQFGGSDNLPLPTTRPLDGGHLQLDGELRGYGFSGGGTLALRALGIRIGDADVAAPDWQLVLPADFFSGQGFGSYVLTAEYDATITAGTVLTPRQHNLLPVYEALLAAPTGSDLRAADAAHPDGIYTRIGELDDYHRQATDFALYAGDYLNWRAAGGAVPDYAAAGISGTVLLDAGAAILADARARVTLGSINQVTVLGAIVAHGGSITLTGDTGNGGYAQNPGLIANGNAWSSRSKSIWLGAASLLDASGTVLLDPLQVALAPGADPLRSGEVLKGGTVTLSSDTGQLVVLGCEDTGSCEDPAATGARIDVSGASGVLDLPAGDRGAFAPQQVWSDGGSVLLGAGGGLYFNGRIDARGGAEAARGGTLAVTALASELGTVNGFAGATRLEIRQDPGLLPAGAGTPGQPIGSGQRPAGVLVFGADRLDGAGIDNLLLGTNPLLADASAPVELRFGPDVSLSSGRLIDINASSIVLENAEGGSQIRLQAPHVALHGYAPGGDYPAAAALVAPAADTVLRVEAGSIDLGGQLALRNVARAEFLASGDIRLLTPSSYGYYRSIDDPTAATAVPGLLLSAGDLLFEAAQLYPATANRFVIDSVGADATVSFRGNGNSAAAATPLSAGGSLLVSAAHIVQDGVLRAPSGQIVLGVADPTDAATQALFSYRATNRRGEPGTVLLPLVATRSVTLGDGSLTSVSLDGLVVPYGQTVDGQNWQYNGSATSAAGAATSVPSLGAPPTKSIALNGAEVTLGEGATIDLSGGGDLQAQEWVAGTGGTRDVLLQYNTVYAGGQARQQPLYADARPVYAIIPGYAGSPAPYDPAIVAGDPLIGQAVYLSGVPGLADGVYTLLPGRYATLPGAFRVVQDTAVRDVLPGAGSTLPDGTHYVAGRFVDTLSGAEDARSTAFFVQSAAVWQQYSQYALSSANAFFPQLAEREGTIAPRLPVDAGQLVLAATRTLGLGATLETGSGAGGAGALVDIASGRIQIVDADSIALPDYVQVRVDELAGLDAASLLIGGTRTRDAEGDSIDAVSTSVVLSNASDWLEAPEIILVASATQPGDGVHLEAGASIRTSGASDAADPVPIRIGSLPQAAAGSTPAVAGVSGDGALLRVSVAGPVAVNRVNVPGDEGVAGSALGVLRIDAGARISGANSILLDSAGNTVVDPGAQFSARFIDANSGTISFLGEGASSAPSAGLVIGAGTLAQFGTAERIGLASRGTMEFLGDVDIALENELRLGAGVFRSDGGTVSIEAGVLALDNGLGAPVAAAVDGSALLRLQADRIEIGGGDKSLAGFGSVEATARNGMLFTGTGSFDLGSATTALHAPVLVADTGSANGLATRGALLIDRADAGQPFVRETLGGTLALAGGSIDLDSTLRAAAGRIDLLATSGDLRLGAGARLDATGVDRVFFDVVRHADGGSIRLDARAGDLVVADGAQLDVSAAAGGGNAGAIDLRAGAGSIEFAGSLAGDAGTGADGGSFSLDSATAVDLDALVARLAAGGFDHRIAVRSGAGNLVLGEGSVLRADSVTLSAGAGDARDATDGNVIVDGTIDVSGAEGGEIALFGSSGVRIEGTLRASSSGSGARGGDIVLGTSGSGNGATDATYGYRLVDADGAGALAIGADALVDVGGAGGGGTLTLRAPLLADGELRVAIDPAAVVRGARAITLEAVATWATSDGSDGGLHFDGIIDPAGAFDAAGNAAANPDHATFYTGTLMQFVQAPAYAFEQRFTGLDNLQVRPGIELLNDLDGVNGGAISVLGDWNLGAGHRESNGTLALDYRHGGLAPVLTLRAIGDVRFAASISDGFFQNNNPFDPANPGATDNSAAPRASASNPLPLLAASLAASRDLLDPNATLRGTDSSSYRIVAGAAVDSADPLALSSANATADLVIEGHQSATWTRRSGSVATVVAPTMIRTGTGSIAIAAADDVLITDTVAPGVIYTAGRPVPIAGALPQAVIIEGAAGMPVVLSSGGVNAEAAGDIGVVAGGDVVGIQKVIDDGSRSGRAGTNLSQYWWPWMQRACVFTGNCNQPPTRSTIDFGIFGQGILSVGGDIAVEAGGDVRDLSVSTPTSWYLRDDGGQAVVVTAGGGDLHVSAGRDILSGAFFVARGEGSISAGRDIRADVKTTLLGNDFPTLLALQDAQLRVRAVRDIDIGGIYNPSYLFRNFDSQRYGEDSAVRLETYTGDVLLRRVSGEFNLGSRSGLGVAYDYILPATLEVAALGGGITIAGNGELYPSPRGQLSLLAEDDVRLYDDLDNNAILGLIDAAPALLPSPLNPIFGSAIAASFIDNGANARFELHSPVALHAADAEPVRIYSTSGSIIDGNEQHLRALILDLPKQALLRAGTDIVDLSYRGQNLLASDVTLISAGRDIYNTPLAPERSVPYIELGGPGQLTVRAGRDVGPITSANDALNLGYLRPNDATYPGIRTVGNQNNAWLPRAGADIAVVFGVAPGIDLEAFAADYIDPAVRHDPADPADAIGTPDYAGALVDFIALIDADARRRAGLAPAAAKPSAAAAWEAFRALPAEQRERFVFAVFFDILDRTGLDFNDPESRFAQQYARGFRAIGTLFPAAAGYTANDGDGSTGPVSTGRFDMRGSTVQTQQGGDIAVIGPGGDVLVGSVSAPPVVPPSQFTAGIGPNNQGLLALEAGEIRVFTDRSVLLAQSRIFTEQGGDILIWSSNGDINAGKGAKTSSEVPPPEFICDPDHYCVIDSGSQVSGAGIAVLQTRVGAESGTANLVAPRGTVDAGDAGIRVSGGLNVAALKVANADNIQASGNAAGVPSGRIDSGALGAANSVAASVNQSAGPAAGARTQDTAMLELSVEVLGFGVVDEDDDDEG